MKKGGIEVSFSNFTAEDGTLVERLVEDYKIPQAARAELEEECKHSKVKADGYRVDSDGKRIGRRVELVAPRSAREPERTMIVWTNGPLLFSLRSESREHVLDFEEQVYPPPESSQALRKQFQ